MKRLAWAFPGLFAIGVLSLCPACGSSGTGGSGRGGAAGSGAGGSAGNGTGGSAGSGTGGSDSTACGSATCKGDQVCAQQGCGGMALPDGGTCTPPAPKCEALPPACKVNPTCACFDSIWTTLGCGTITYGTLQCARPCA